jgi:hypothetical protein
MPRKMTSPCKATSDGRAIRFSSASHAGPSLGFSSYIGVAVGSGVQVGNGIAAEAEDADVALG